MELSVIIVNWNSYSFLERCIKTLRLVLVGMDFEIIVVDNKSSAEEIKKLRRLDGIELLENDRNMGFAVACNKGYRISNGEYILFLNPDTLVEKDSIGKMVRFLSENNKVAILGPRLVEKNGEIQRSCYRYPNLISEFFLITGLNKLFPNNFVSRWERISDWSHNSIKEVEWVSGASLLTKRAILEDIGLMDEEMFMYREDMELCYRARKSGYKVVYFSNAEIYHYGGASSAKAKEIELEENRLKSIALFFRKSFGKRYFYSYLLLIYFIFNIKAFLSLIAILFQKSQTQDNAKLHHYLKIAKVPFLICRN